MEIWQAIQELLQIKEYCTVAEIAKITEKKQAFVLHQINRNKDFLRIDKKKGRIVGFQNIIARQRDEAFRLGKCYKATHTYYIDILEVRNPTDFHHLLTKHSYGFYADVYNQSVIKDTAENRKALEDAGLVEYQNYPVHRINVLWILT